MGLACIRSHIGVFSFGRYLEPTAADDAAALLLARACKTAVHELLHMHGVRMTCWG